MAKSVMQAHQATCVAINSRAIIIEGAPGCGKSSLALSLIDRGAVLIGDDSLLISTHLDRALAHPHPNTRGLLEVRNLGLLEFPVREAAPIALVIRLSAEAPRFIETTSLVMLAGVAVPMLYLCQKSSPLHLKAELALEKFGLR